MKYLSTSLLATLALLSCHAVFAKDLTVTITHREAGAERCMDLSTDRKSIVFNACNNENTQKWHINAVSEKYNRIRNNTLPADNCLFSNYWGTQIGMQGCTSGTYLSQAYWEVIKSQDNQYSLRSKIQVDRRQSGWLSLHKGALALNIEDAATGKWTFADTDVKQYTSIINSIVGQNQCMDLADDKTKVVFNRCDRSPTQQWVLQGSGTFSTLKNATLPDNVCLFSITNGARVDMRECNSGTFKSQTLWRINAKANEHYAIISKVQNDYGRNGQLSVDRDDNLTLNDPAGAVGHWRLPDYTPPKRNMKGDVSVLLLNTHFTGASPQPTQDIRKALFGGNGPYTSLKEYLALASRGALTLKEGKTLDNLDIGPRGDSCDYASYRSKAIELAKAQGVDAADYDVIYLEHTHNNKCSYIAIASIPTRLDLPGKYIVSNAAGHKYWMWTHEFGHTLGFAHARMLANCPGTSTGVRIDSTCALTGGSDSTDTMNGGGGRMYPVNYMHEAGWLTDTQLPVVGNGTYTIAPLLSDKEGYQGIRLSRNDPAFPYLVLEFRQPTHFDQNWPADSPFISGVVVRAISPTSSNSLNAIINTQPGSSASHTSPLMPGKTLHDTYSGKLITVAAVSPEGAVVTISDAP